MPGQEPTFHLTAFDKDAKKQAYKTLFKAALAQAAGMDPQKQEKFLDYYKEKICVKAMPNRKEKDAFRAELDGLHQEIFPGFSRANPSTLTGTGTVSIRSSADAPASGAVDMKPRVPRSLFSRFMRAKRPAGAYVLDSALPSASLSGASSTSSSKSEFREVVESDPSSARSFASPQASMRGRPKGRGLQRRLGSLVAAATARYQQLRVREERPSSQISEAESASYPSLSQHV